jgi:hypothetical protein
LTHACPCCPIKVDPLPVDPIYQSSRKSILRELASPSKAQPEQIECQEQYIASTKIVNMDSNIALSQSASKKRPLPNSPSPSEKLHGTGPASPSPRKYDPLCQGRTSVIQTFNIISEPPDTQKMVNAPEGNQSKDSQKIMENQHESLKQTASIDADLTEPKQEKITNQHHKQPQLQRHSIIAKIKERQAGRMPTHLRVNTTRVATTDELLDQEK